MLDVSSDNAAASTTSRMSKVPVETTVSYEALVNTLGKAASCLPIDPDRSRVFRSLLHVPKPALVCACAGLTDSD